MNAQQRQRLFSSATVEWPTPQFLFDALDAEFRFSLDPCSNGVNAKCKKFFTQKDDGLAQDWSADRVFMNPPYGRVLVDWMRKAFEESRRGALVVCLIPARTDTLWWHRYATRGEIRFFAGRLTFEGGESTAPFPSAVVVFRPPVAS